MSISFLVIGGGGREHALAHTLARSSHTTHVYVAPGNGGTAGAHSEIQRKIRNIDINAEDLDRLSEFVDEHAIDYTIVGPEAPLAAGIVDRWLDMGLACFGPTKNAARLESSKAYAKGFMERWNIPTASGASFTRYDDARDYLSSIDWKPVIKASGLAAGKGVILPDDDESALRALHEIMVERVFGEAGCEVVIEERLEGYEISLLVVSDGSHIRPLPAARDHKRQLDGDQGPNTGGMGAIAPVLAPDQALHGQLMDIMQSVVTGMAAEGQPYVGILYGGFMITPTGPKVLEFNCRFGDPETQAVLAILGDEDLVSLITAASNGDVSGVSMTEPAAHAATVVMASGGYPGPYEKGVRISGIESAQAHPNVLVFHAGTEWVDGVLRTCGGRVLGVTGLGDTRSQALENAYQAIQSIKFDGAQYRTDIGRTRSE